METIAPHDDATIRRSPCAIEVRVVSHANVERVVHGKPEEIRLVLAALISGGHVLLEDMPGTAKTVLARSLAVSIAGASFSRIQCTPDLQPTDVTGLSIFDQRTREFEFRPGPVFAHVLLVDEINRAMPKTQSALLEAMAEKQVTVEGVDPPARGAVPRPRDAEPDRAGGHVPAAGGAARPVRDQDDARLPAASKTRYRSSRSSGTRIRSSRWARS